MARPREFDEAAVLDAAVECFWRLGYEATSVRDLIEKTGITCASLYNAFGDKRAIYQRALDHYVEANVAARIRRCEALPPRRAIEAYFGELLERALGDSEHKGCMLVNAALEALPGDPGFRAVVSEALARIEGFFRARIVAGQADGTISDAAPADDLARHLLGILMGVRVLSRVRPERALLEAVVTPALALLDPKAAPLAPPTA